jgi:hypothetical protein
MQKASAEKKSAFFHAKSWKKTQVCLFALQKGRPGILPSREHSEIARLLHAYYPDM